MMAGKIAAPVVQACGMPRPGPERVEDPQTLKALAARKSYRMGGGCCK